MADKTIDWVFRATDKTAAAFRSVDSRISGIQNSLKGFAGFAGFAALATGVGSLVTHLVELGSELQDASEKLGVSAESLQVLKFAAEQTGGSFDGLQAALAYNTKLTEAAVEGNQEAAQTFRQLGIDAKKFADLPIDRRLAVVAEQLKNVSDPALRLALTLKALGKGGADLAPLMAQGADGLAAFRKEAEDSNLIISDESVKALDDLGDAWDKFTTRAYATFVPYVTGTLEGFTALIDKAKEYGKALNDGRLYITNSGFEVVPELTKGPTNARRRPGLTASDRTVINAKAGTAASDAQIAAAEKAASAAAKQQALMAKAAEKTAGEIASLTDDIAKLSNDANHYFDDRGKELTEKYRPAIDVLKDSITEVNNLFSAGAISSETANAAILDYGDAYASTMDRVKDKNADVKDSTQSMFEQLKLSTDGYARDLTDALFDATQTIGQYFEQLAVTIAKALFTQSVTEPLLRSILGSAASSDLLGGIFGGPRAAGGPVAAGSAYLVGERGPELFVPGRSGSIVPNGAGGEVVNVALTINQHSLDPHAAASSVLGQERLITGMIRRATLRAGRRPSLA